MQGFNKFVLTILMISVFTLLGCQPEPPRYSTSMDDMHGILEGDIETNKKLQAKNTPNTRIPVGVRNSLYPSMHAHNNEVFPKKEEHRFDVSANKMIARDFFMSLVEGTPINMMVNPNVTGTITLNLKNVTIEEAMDAVRDVYGYEYRRTSYGYEILAPQIQSQIFNVNYLDVQRTGKSYTQLTTGQITEQIGSNPSNNGTSGVPTPVLPNANNPDAQDGSNVKTQSKLNFWQDLKTTLENMVGTAEGRSVVINPQGGVVIVKAYPRELNRVARYLDKIQSSMNRQVIIEAKVLEVQLNDDYQAGIDWNAFGKGNQAFIDPVTGNVIPSGSGAAQSSLKNFEGTSLKDFDSIFTLNIKGNFGALIKLLQTQGNVQVLSSPRISTVNNQKAVIKVGQDQFFVTGVSTNNFVTANATVPTQNVNLTPFFSGVTLDVTPQISKTGEIILHIHPSVSVVKKDQQNIQLGTVQGPTSTQPTPNTLSLPLALSTIRETDNIVRAKNGQIVVIGGLMQNNMSEEIGGVPGLSKLPFVGTVFRRTHQVSSKSELVILLRPVIADNRSFNNDIEKANQGMYRYERGYHVGGLPEVFGTQGERSDN